MSFPAVFDSLCLAASFGYLRRRGVRGGGAGDTVRINHLVSINTWTGAGLRLETCCTRWPPAHRGPFLMYKKCHKRTKRTVQQSKIFLPTTTASFMCIYQLLLSFTKDLQPQNPEIPLQVYQSSSSTHSLFTGLNDFLNFQQWNKRNPAKRNGPV